MGSETAATEKSKTSKVELNKAGSAKTAKSKTSTVIAKNNKIEKNWLKVRQNLQARLGAEVFDSWFGRMKVEAISGGVAIHSVPTAFLKSWINTHYRDIISEIWAKEDSSVLRVDIVVRSAVRHQMVSKRTDSQDKYGAGKNSDQGSRFGGEPSLTKTATGDDRKDFANSNSGNKLNGSPLDPKYTFANFIEGKSNRMACAAARSVAESDNASNFNPLFIHASVGLGKTHLLQAIALETRAREPKKRVHYLTADFFMWRFASALRDQTALTLKESLRDIDLLLIDDMQFLQGKAIQAEFCHLLNELIDSAKQVVVAADRPPAELESLNERVRSRLKGGVAIMVETPDYELRKAILNLRYEEAKRDQPNLDIPEDIRHYVARQVNTSCRDIDGAFNQLLLQHKYSDGADGYEDIDNMLQHLVRSSDNKNVRIEDIQKVVSRQFNVNRNDLLSNRRTRVIVRPRQIAMYLAKSMTPRSLPEIGRRFGGRDHTTVLHAVRKVEDLIVQDPKLAQEIELLKRLIMD